MKKPMQAMAILIVLLSILFGLLMDGMHKRIRNLEKRYQQLEDMLPWIPNC